MNPNLHRVFRALAPGETLSGQALADRLGLTRAAVWKAVEQLRGLGLGIEARAGSGYRLDPPVEVLNADAIQDRLGDLPVELEIMPGTPSTNAELAGRPAEKRHGQVVLAEHQSAGRGRRGRSWISPPGAGLYLSLAWRLEAGRARVSTLSLVAGLAAARAVETVCGKPVQLKWPNDLLMGSRKAGGCLVEISGLADGPFDAIIGIGLNVQLPDSAPRPDQPWTDLFRETGCRARNHLAGALVRQLVEDLNRLEASGFDDFQEAWRARDVLASRSIVIHAPDGSSRPARALGVSASGGLRVETGAGEEELVAGEVSVRV